MPSGVYVRTEKHKKIMRENLPFRYWLGKKRPPFSKEWIENLSKVTKGKNNGMYGRKQTEESKEKNRLWHLGKEYSKETRRKVGESCKGKKHYNWKEGITPENQRIRASIEIRFWREAIFARDNYTCQKCKKQDGILRCHHIQNFSQFPELRFAIDNGITFCIDCHLDFHKEYGRQNNNYEQIKEFIFNILKYVQRTN